LPVNTQVTISAKVLLLVTNVTKFVFPEFKVSLQAMKDRNSSINVTVFHRKSFRNNQNLARMVLSFIPYGVILKANNGIKQKMHNNIIEQT
jgi:hypothetical protein